MRLPSRSLETEQGEAVDTPNGLHAALWMRTAGFRHQAASEVDPSIPRILVADECSSERIGVWGSVAPPAESISGTGASAGHSFDIESLPTDTCPASGWSRLAVVLVHLPATFVIRGNEVGVHGDQGRLAHGVQR